MTPRTNTIAFREERARPETPLPLECVLILTPLGRDAEYTQHLLRKTGIRSEICSDLIGMCDIINENIGVLLIAEEALTNHEAPRLIELLNGQPKWSDLPIVIFTSGGETTETTRRVTQLFEKSANVTLLERPVHGLTLISSIQTSLRARRRQWEIRDLLAQRQQLLEEARSAREDAELANRMKDQFLATLSHELRTPLNAILGWTQLLASDHLSAEDIRIGIETIDRNARTQAQLIEDLLDVSRIVSGKLRLEVQEIEVDSVLRAAIAAVAPTASARTVQLVYEPDTKSSEPLKIFADPARLQQIVWNLLSNAVKFTPKGGRVAVRTALLDAGSRDEKLQVRVQDNGIGIDSAFLPYVFDRFRQADGSSTRRQGGLGLGLSIVKQLVEMHHGSVGVTSDGVGRGTTFTVTLPVAQPGEAERAAKAHHDRSLEEDPSGRHDLSGMRVLIVDDEADARNVLKRLLSDRNAVVRVAESVTRALSLIDESRPDVIISDISMPERDGFELLHEIRTDGHDARDVPVIALTALARSEDRDRILRAGFSAHLAKPLDTSELMDALNRI